MSLGCKKYSGQSSKKLSNALTNKINATLELIDKGYYLDAIDKLQSDILGKTNGCIEIGEPTNGLSQELHLRT